MDDPPLVGIHELQEFGPARRGDQAGHLLGVIAELLLLALAEEFAVDLDFLVRDLVQDVLQGEEELAVLPEQELLVRPVEDDEEDLALLPDLVGDLERKDLEEAVQERRDRVLVSGPLRPGPDDDLLADPEEPGLLGDDLVVELGPRQLELVLGVEDRVLEVLALELGGGGVNLFFVFHRLRSSCFS